MGGLVWFLKVKPVFPLLAETHDQMQFTTMTRRCHSTCVRTHITAAAGPPAVRPAAVGAGSVAESQLNSVKGR